MIYPFIHSVLLSMLGALIVLLLRSQKYWSLETFKLGKFFKRRKGRITWAMILILAITLALHIDPSIADLLENIGIKYRINNLRAAPIYIGGLIMFSGNFLKNLLDEVKE